MATVCDFLFVYWHVEHKYSNFLIHTIFNKHPVDWKNNANENKSLLKNRHFSLIDFTNDHL